MARRTEKVVIPGRRVENASPGHRDDGKVFVITEMPADQAERWCSQVMFLIWQARGEEPPEDPSDHGSAGLVKNGINFADIRVMKALQDPSLDELWDCVKYLHAPNHPPQPIITGENSQIEEIATRTRLRMEVLQLHLGFSQAAERRSSAGTANPKG